MNESSRDGGGMPIDRWTDFVTSEKLVTRMEYWLQAGG